MISFAVSRSWMQTRVLTNKFKVLSQVRCMSGGHDPQPIKVDIGTREVVGFGNNGEQNYTDDFHYPFPAIRFQEDSTGNIKALREKEKGDWKKMTLEDKKGLYRASFANTFSEIGASEGVWKVYIGSIGLALGITILIYCAMVEFVYPPLPTTITDEKKVVAQIHRMVKLNMEPMSGVPTLYDYEKKEWKK